MGRRCILKWSLPIAIAALSGCVSLGSINVEIPSSKLDAFGYCMAAKGGKCSKSAQTGKAVLLASAPGPVDDSVSFAAAGASDAWSIKPLRESEKALYRAHGAADAQVEQLSSARYARRKELNEQFSVFISHPVTTALANTYNGLRSGDSASTPAKSASFSYGEVREYVQLATTLTQNNGWQVAKEDATSSDRNAYAAYLEAYIAAYFRNGEFGSVGFTLDDFYKRFPQLTKFKKELDPELKAAETTLTFGKNGQGAFISRVGRHLQFPPLEINVDPTKHTVVTVSKIEYADVGADFVRVIVEALFDAHDQLPAVANATGVTSTLFRASEEAIRLKDNSKTKPNLTADQFTQSASLANSAEGLAAAGTGQVIRGINIAALNNEALAKIIEAMVGSITRKATEKTTYCWFACVVGQAPKELIFDGSLISNGGPGDSTAKVTIQFAK
jgi:dsRNA-specific ribonuclease